MSTDDNQRKESAASSLPLTRRHLVQLGTLGLASAMFPASNAPAQSLTQHVPAAFAKLRNKAALNIGILIFPGIDQIDFTGPFEVLVRVPGAKIHIIGTQADPVRDYNGLVLTPEMTLADTPELDLLVVPGGPGQQALMQDEQVLEFIRRYHATGKPLFSVCTGALLCGGAGILHERRATTHWSTIALLPYFGAIAVDQRVVIDDEIVSAAGVTAGIDGALIIAALLRGDAAAQRIQLGIQYAPEPPFQAGLPSTAPADVLDDVTAKIKPLTESRLQTAKAYAAQMKGRTD
ncbi:DJ-1/PfpI family protein [Blastopirellula sp. J2-11]|uniref:DJ-1/PfpI family protein n=1 Tax=Blastopirellula sp. J2-11 TaxID=2943192 RepID=UPI0021C6F5D6|nr:DJ-1/PfpI family protein [Blastopirellula sp. J2-11]UUO04790.1 DJ-1/PfpI family protein [Blastopirellula sp. J2-11]